MGFFVTKPNELDANEFARCELCNDLREIADLRNYGINGERICFPCGMKNEAVTKAVFAKTMGAA